MDWELRRLLEHAGILRRGTPNSMLFEGDDDDPFGGGDDEFWKKKMSDGGGQPRST